MQWIFNGDVVTEPEPKGVILTLDEYRRLTGIRRPGQAKPERIAGWSIQKSKDGYFRAFKRIDGRAYGVFLGRSLENAAAKINLKESEIMNRSG